MKKKLVLAIFSLHTALFASVFEITDEEKSAASFSQSAMLAEKPLPLSDNPFFYRLTDPDGKLVYLLGTKHTNPLESALANETIEWLFDTVSLVVSETVGELGEPLAKEVFADHGLVMDDVVRQQFIDAEKSYIQKRPAFLAKKPFQEELGDQAEWLKSWYTSIPESVRQVLESNPNLLVGKDVLPELHPALVAQKIERDLGPEEQEDQKRRAWGMDSVIERLTEDRKIKYLGLESERNVLDAGRLKELQDEVQDFMDNSYPTPIQRLQEIDQMLQEASALPYGREFEKPVWTGEEVAELVNSDYFKGNFLEYDLCESSIKRTENWMPKILDIASTHSCPWLLMVGVNHTRGEQGLLHWFEKTLGYKVERFSNVTKTFG